MHERPVFRDHAAPDRFVETLAEVGNWQDALPKDPDRASGGQE